MMRRAVGALTILFVLMLMSPPVQPAPRFEASLTFIQDGVVSADNTVKVDLPFEIHGEGFRAFSPAWVCPAGEFCIKTPVNADGTFVIKTSLPYTGDYVITVFQYRNPAGKNSDEVLITTLSVV